MLLAIVLLSSFAAARVSSTWTESPDVAAASAEDGGASVSSIPASQSRTDRLSFPAELQEDQEDEQSNELASAKSSDSISSPRLCGSRFPSTEVFDLTRAVCAVCLARAPPFA